MKAIRACNAQEATNWLIRLGKYLEAEPHKAVRGLVHPDHLTEDELKIKAAKKARAKYKKKKVKSNVTKQSTGNRGSSSAVHAKKVPKFLPDGWKKVEM